LKTEFNITNYDTVNLIKDIKEYRKLRLTENFILIYRLTKIKSELQINKEAK